MPYWSHIQEGWEHRHCSNVLFMFYEDMNKVIYKYFFFCVIFTIYNKNFKLFFTRIYQQLYEKLPNFWKKR